MAGFLTGAGAAVILSIGALLAYDRFAIPAGDRFDGAEVHLPHEVATAEPGNAE